MSGIYLKLEAPAASHLQNERLSRMARAAASAAQVAPRNQAVAASRQILRFHRSERVLHWSIAIPFMVCYATAAILLIFFNLRSPALTRAAFSWLHRIAGACLILFPLLTGLRNRGDYRLHLDNVKHAWSWAVDDVKWLLLMGAAAISSRVSLPEQGKFNAAEKLNFMMVMGTYPLFIVTGLLLWMPKTAFVSWVIHVALAAVATPLMLGHIYMALINPGTRVGLGGMLSGYVDRRWAKHHYARWYRENFEGDSAHREAGKAAPQLRRPARMRCPSCRGEHLVKTWVGLLEAALELQPFWCSRCGTKADRVPVLVEREEVVFIQLGLEQAGLGELVEISAETGLLRTRTSARSPAPQMALSSPPRA